MHAVRAHQPVRGVVSPVFMERWSLMGRCCSAVLPSCMPLRHAILAPSTTCRVLAVCFARDTAARVLLVSSSSDRSLRLWVVGAARCVRMLTKLPAEVTALCSARSGRIVVLGDRGGGVAVWELARANRPSRLRGWRAGAAVSALAPSPHAARPHVLVGAADGSVILLDWEAQTTLVTLARRPADIQCVRWAALGPGGAVPQTGLHRASGASVPARGASDDEGGFSRNDSSAQHQSDSARSDPDVEPEGHGPTVHAAGAAAAGNVLPRSPPASIAVVTCAADRSADVYVEFEAGGDGAGAGLQLIGRCSLPKPPPGLSDAQRRRLWLGAELCMLACPSADGGGSAGVTPWLLLSGHGGGDWAGEGGDVGTCERGRRGNGR